MVAFVPDLLFGSNVLAQLRASGHEAVLVSDVEHLREAMPADAVVVDLTADAAERVEHVRGLGVPVLAFYSHVEADIRALAQRAGLDLVVPRSRMAREGARLVDRLLRSAT